MGLAGLRAGGQLAVTALLRRRRTSDTRGRHRLDPAFLAHHVHHAGARRKGDGGLRRLE